MFGWINFLLQVLRGKLRVGRLKTQSQINHVEDLLQIEFIFVTLGVLLWKGWLFSWKLCGPKAVEPQVAKTPPLLDQIISPQISNWRFPKCTIIAHFTGFCFSKFLYKLFFKIHDVQCSPLSLFQTKSKGLLRTGC